MGHLPDGAGTMSVKMAEQNNALMLPHAILYIKVHELTS